jgi:hypothetical protein
MASFFGNVIHFAAFLYHHAVLAVRLPARLGRSHHFAVQRRIYPRALRKPDAALRSSGTLLIAQPLDQALFVAGRIATERSLHDRFG